MMPIDEPDDSLQEFRRATRRRRLVLLGVALAALLLVGLLPVPLGAGFFGWRLVRYERVDLHFVNITGETVRIQIGGASGEFPGGRVHSLRFRAGEVTLEATGEGGRPLETIALYTDNQSVFYNLGDRHCFVLLEATAMYDPGRDGPPLRVAGRITPDDRITLIPPGVFIPPRGVLGDTVPGGQRVWWIDDIACVLLDPEEENVLLAQQMIRMEGRREERRRRLQEAGAGPAP
jgi:hypothetical protein